MTNAGNQPRPRFVRGLPTAPRGERAPRVCIATSDLRGPVRNGGVGTACAVLAETLASAGHDITLLYLGDFESGDEHDWRDRYAGRGVHLVVPRPTVPLSAPSAVAASYVAYEWLKQQPAFDVIQFPDLNGVGFYALQAKRLGLALQTSFLCVALHSPTIWHRYENREQLDREEDLIVTFMERESLRLCDAVVSPTEYLVRWVADWGFELPDRVYVCPYLTEPAPAPPARPASGPLTELVFFGRLETRKGLAVFCDALDLLASSHALAGLSVSFLGKSGRVGVEDGVAFVRRRTGRLGVPVTIETGWDQTQAMAALRSRPALAVMPSLADNMPYAVLECIGERIPFVAAATGGIPEAIAAEDHAAVLVSAHAAALAERLERCVREGQAPARPACEPERVRAQWIGWHELLASAPELGTAAVSAQTAPPPLVSVCIATRNRHELLHQALASIRQQTYPAVEVVLVDDASDRRDSIAALESLERDEAFASGAWQLLRRQTRGYPSACRNDAAARSRGHYLLFMDDDNLARPDEIATFVTASRHAGVPLLTCLADLFETSSDNSERVQRWLPLGAATAAGFVANRFGDTNLLIDRETFIALGGFDEQPGARFAEDWVFLSRAALRGTSMAVVPEALFRYRIWPGGHGQRQDPLVSQYARLQPYLDGLTVEQRALVLYGAGLHERHRTAELKAQAEARRTWSLSTRFETATSVAVLGPADGPRLRTAGDLRVAPAADAIALISQGSDPIAWLPVRLPAFSRAILRLDVTAERPTLVQLFWPTRTDGGPSEAQSAWTAVPAGRSSVWLEIPAVDHVGCLRLDPGVAPGTLLLHQLEVRVEGDGAARRRRGWIGSRTAMPLPEASERFQSARPVLSVGPEGGRLRGLQQAEISRLPEGLGVRSLGDDPQLELPHVVLPRRPLIVRLDMTAPAETMAQVFWATRWRAYREEQSARCFLSAGRNVAYFDVSPGARALRLDPGTCPGQFVVHALDVRAER